LLNFGPFPIKNTIFPIKMTTFLIKIPLLKSAEAALAARQAANLLATATAATEAEQRRIATAAATAALIEAGKGKEFKLESIVPTEGEMGT
jgi:hypothetical protein